MWTSGMEQSSYVHEIQIARYSVFHGSPKGTKGIFFISGSDMYSISDPEIIISDFEVGPCYVRLRDSKKKIPMSLWAFRMSSNYSRFRPIESGTQGKNTIHCESKKTVPLLFLL